MSEQENKRKSHEIDSETLNTCINYCIDEYVRLIEHREMLRDKWFFGLSLKQLADKYHKSDTAVKDVIYGTGDSVLLRAEKMSKKQSKYTA